MHRNWKKLLQPRILIPVLLAFPLLVFIFGISDIAKVFALIIRIHWATLLIIALLVSCYLLLKGYVLYLMLKKLGIRPGWKPLVVSFMLGELNITLPFGIFIQNYVMSRLHVAGFGRSAAATTAMLAVEAIVVLAALMILGLPQLEWGRSSIAGLVIVATLALPIAYRKQQSLSRVINWLNHNRLQKYGRELAQLVQGFIVLLEPQLIGRAILVTAGYLLALIAGLMLIARDMQISQLTFMAATNIYLVSLAVVLLVGGIAPHVGTMEVTAIGVARFWGLSATEVLAIMLGLRLTWTIMTWLLGSVLIGVLRDAFQGIKNEKQ